MTNKFYVPYRNVLIYVKNTNKTLRSENSGYVTEINTIHEGATHNSRNAQNKFLTNSQQIAHHNIKMCSYLTLKYMPPINVNLCSHGVGEGDETHHREKKSKIFMCNIQHCARSPKYSGQRKLLFSICKVIDKNLLIELSYK